jgi:hypothetical protein
MMCSTTLNKYSIGGNDMVVFDISLINKCDLTARMESANNDESKMEIEKNQLENKNEGT